MIEPWDEVVIGDFQMSYSFVQDGEPRTAFAAIRAISDTEEKVKTCAEVTFRGMLDLHEIPWRRMSSDDAGDSNPEHRTDP